MKTCSAILNLERQLIDAILVDANIGLADKIQEYVKSSIMNRKIDDLNMLAFHEKLHKNLDDYKKTSPHIVAAKKLEEYGWIIRKGDLISYVITYDGPEPLTYASLEDYNPKYYIDKHLQPMVKNLYKATGLSKPVKWYEYYLKTQHWLNLRYNALETADNKCQLCGETKNLEVHHNTYERLWNEKPSDLVVLCHHHHTMISEEQDRPKELKKTIGLEVLDGTT